MRYVIFVLLLILTSTSTYTQVIISEVDPNRPSVVFKNVSDQPVYLGDFGFRSGFFDFGTTGLCAFNKKTFGIDWQYRFDQHDDYLKTDNPQLSGNKLYQLSADKVLYVFEKEEDV